MHDISQFDPFASTNERATTSQTFQPMQDDPSWVLLLGGAGGQENGKKKQSSDNVDDEESVALLKEVFPDASVEELKKLHQERLSNLSLPTDNEPNPTSFHTLNPNNYTEVVVTPIQSILGRRILSQLSHLSPIIPAVGSAESNTTHACESYANNDVPSLNATPSIRVEFPKDFLRIPAQIALQLRNPSTGRMEWKLVQYLQDTVVRIVSETEDLLTLSSATAKEFIDFSCVVSRQYPVGLGMTICERAGEILVLSLVSIDGQRIFHEDSFVYSGTLPRKKSILSLIPEEKLGPAQAAGVLTGDRILGINGYAFDLVSPTHCITNSETNGSAILKKAGETIVNTADPIVLHIRRYLGEKPPTQKKTDTTASQSFPTTTLISSPRIPQNTSEHYLSERDPTMIIEEHMGLQCDELVYDPKQTNDSYINLHTPNSTVETRSSTPSLLGDSPVSCRTDTAKSHKEKIHPFAAALRQRGLLPDSRGELEVTQLLEEFTMRTRQWESKSSFFINSETGKIEDMPDPRDLLPEEASVAMPFEHSKTRFRSFAPSTPPLSLDEFRLLSSHTEKSVENLKPSGRSLLSGASMYPRFRKRSNAGFKTSALVCVPLAGVRKALSVRIVHYFLDGDKLAYTIWIYDTETGKEWYAPVRYFQDFLDLRTSIGFLVPSLGQIPFPALGWGAALRGQARESQSSKDGRCKQLEEFLRALSGVIYTSRPFCKDLVEASIHLQSFLCCDSCLVENDNVEDTLSQPASSTTRDMEDACGLKMTTRTQLKRSIQRYTYRLFLLPIVRLISEEFVRKTTDRAQNANQMIEVNIAAKKSLKDIALEDLQLVKDFLDQMQALILDGCRDDFIAISRRRDYSALGFSNEMHDNARDSILIEGLREQLEIEIYVPIRSMISRQVVNGWKNDDMEIKFKIQALKSRPQSWFKISKENQRFAACLVCI